MKTKAKTQLRTDALSTLTSLDELRTILESLPLATDEYGCALNHLNNAQSYFQQGEFGAGHFELNMLKAKLDRR